MDDSKFDDLAERERKGEEMMDEHRYADAIKYFRELLRDFPPTWFALGNLSIAELNERVGHRRIVSAQFPESFDAARDEVQALMDAGFARQAHDRCTSLLERDSWSAGEKRSFRFARIDAGIQGNWAVRFCEDTSVLLEHQFIHNPVASKVGKLLASRILKISNPCFIGPLELLQSRFKKIVWLVRIIDLKVQQLKVLEELE